MNAQSGTFSVLSCTLSAPITYVARLQWLRVLNPLSVLRKLKALPRAEADAHATTPAPTTRPPTTPPAPSRLDGTIAHVRGVPAYEKHALLLFLISCSFTEDREKGLSVGTYYV